MVGESQRRIFGLLCQLVELIKKTHPAIPFNRWEFYGINVDNVLLHGGQGCRTFVCISLDASMTRIYVFFFLTG